MEAGESTVLRTNETAPLLLEALRFAGIGVCRCLPDGTLLEIDAGILHLFELSEQYPDPRQALGQPLDALATFAEQIVDPSESPDAVRRNRACRVVTRRGTTKWVLSHSYPAVDPMSGQACRHIILHDVTDHLRDRQAAQVREARRQGLVEDAGIGIAILGLDGLIRESNQALRALLGRSPEAMARMPFAHCFDLERHADAARAYHEVLAGARDSMSVESSCCGLDGVPRSCEVCCLLIREANQVPHYVVAIVKDRQAPAELEQAKSRFLSVLTHELRTPLTNIIGWVQAALDAPEVAPEALQIILRNAQRQHRMLSNLLEVSRLFHDRLRLRTEAADLWQVAERALARMQPHADALAVRLHSIPPEQPLAISADVKRLEGVVCNLLDNAIKFTPPDGTVIISAWARAGQAYLQVRDTGCGIAPSQLPALFHPLPYRGVERYPDGLRLGLAVVKHLVELHGGQVQADSAGEGYGSTFTIRLPCQR